MFRRLLNKLKRQQVATREVIMPGALMIALVCLIRFSSLLQTQEWMMLDTFSRHCPKQNRSRRVMLVSVDERDYQTTGFPISADILAQALTNLQTYRPRVIGLDIFRDLPQGQGQDMLQKIMASSPNVVAAEVALSAEPTMNVQAPEGTPGSQVGFVDSVVDADGKVRRMVLSAKKSIDLPKDQPEGQPEDLPEDRSKSSLALLLARQYLSSGNRAIDETKLPKFHANSGGYIRTSVEGEQLLMNFCMLQSPYETISLRDVLSNNINAEKVRDRIVLIGKTATDAKNSFITSAASSTLYSEQISSHTYPTKIIYGVEIHGHATEQIIDSLLGKRCALETWNELSEYIWIVAWGAVGIAISVVLQAPWKSICTLAASILILGLFGYYLLTQSIWIPVVPAALALSSAGLITAFFDRDIRFELQQRQATIERTYAAVHSGPLQRLAEISRRLSTSGLEKDSLTKENLTKESPTKDRAESEYLSSTADFPPKQLLRQIQLLNTDMRNIFESMRRETIPITNSLYLDSDTLLNLQEPLSTLLYKVYEHTLADPLPGFKHVQVYITPVFEIFESRRFSKEEKRGLCLFLQEALLNAGNYAVNATRIEVVCLAEEATYRLQIIDNGSGISTPRKPGQENRQGTRQALAIAHKLKGQFRRRPNLPTGTCCELSWPIKLR